MLISQPVNLFQSVKGSNKKRIIEVMSVVFGWSCDGSMSAPMRLKVKSKLLFDPLI